MRVPAFADNTNPQSLAARFRARRRQLFIERMAPQSEERILDVGGSEQAWRGYDFAHRVTILNLERACEDVGLCRFVQGDALDMPFPDKSFGLVVANSVVEHVGDFARQQRFAQEIRRVGERFWVQAPNRAFPLEPHFLFPGFQFLPLSAQLVVGRNWPLSWAKHYHVSPTEIDESIRFLRLPTAHEFRWLFPDGVLFHEMACGLPKSLVIHSRRD